MEKNLNYSLINNNDFEKIIDFFFEKNQKRTEIFSDENIKKIINENLSFKCSIINKNKDKKEEEEIISVVLLTKKEKNILIFLIKVKKEYRRKGIGSRIIKESIENAKSFFKNKNEEIYFSLHVNLNNTIALNMYKKLGFVIDKYLENFYVNMIPKGKEKEIGKCYHAYEMILK